MLSQITSRVIWCHHYSLARLARPYSNLLQGQQSMLWLRLTVHRNNPKYKVQPIAYTENLEFTHDHFWLNTIAYLYCNTFKHSNFKWTFTALARKGKTNLSLVFLSGCPRYCNSCLHLSHYTQQNVQLWWDSHAWRPTHAEATTGLMSCILILT